MLMTIPKQTGYEDIKEHEIIAIERGTVFVGYITVIAVLENDILIDADPKVKKVFDEILSKGIPFDIDLINHKKED
jgi:hypothetical protein